MPVRTVDVGYAAGQGRGRKDSADSKTPHSSRNTANLLIEPFPAPKIPPLGLKHLPNVPPATYTMSYISANCKSVMSGDSLILTSIKNPNNERTLSLAYCTAPHIKKDADELGAYDSRDALRDLVVGKQIQFQVLYTIPNTKREYGIVLLPDGRRLPEEIVKEGWLKLREDAGRKEDSEDALQQLDHLRLLEAKARTEDKGLWSPNLNRIDLQHDMGDSQAFIEVYKGKELDGLVERVLSGDRMLVRLLISPTKHINGKFHMFGLKIYLAVNNY
jgi:staphylococcal nuclease domain-containing protein 1